LLSRLRELFTKAKPAPLHPLAQYYALKELRRSDIPARRDAAQDMGSWCCLGPDFVAANTLPVFSLRQKPEAECKAPTMISRLGG
jgi:hypothetical protein